MQKHYRSAADAASHRPMSQNIAPTASWSITGSLGECLTEHERF